MARARLPIRYLIVQKLADQNKLAPKSHSHTGYDFDCKIPPVKNGPEDLWKRDENYELLWLSEE